jgi:hypothetical protein
MCLKKKNLDSATQRIICKTSTYDPKENHMTIPSSVVEFVLPHQMASLMRGGANAGPWRNDELCPKGTPRSDEVATAPPKARTSSPCKEAIYTFTLLSYKAYKQNRPNKI